MPAPEQLPARWPTSHSAQKGPILGRNHPASSCLVPAHGEHQANVSPGGASYLRGPGLGFGLEARGPPASPLARAAQGTSRLQPLV